jgi:endoglucanase
MYYHLLWQACHRLNDDAWPGDGLWYDASITETKVLASWTALTKKLCGQWNVFAADLQNEPHSASWGKDMGHGSDWGHAAERIGNHVLKQCPRWMIMVEGVGERRASEI